MACTIAMNVELRKIGEAARYLSLSSIVPNRILSKDSGLAEGVIRRFACPAAAAIAPGKSSTRWAESYNHAYPGLLISIWITSPAAA